LTKRSHVCRPNSYAVSKLTRHDSTTCSISKFSSDSQHLLFRVHADRLLNEFLGTDHASSNCEFAFRQTRRRAFALRARSTSASSQVVLEDRVNRTHAILPIDFFAFRIGPAAVGNADFVDSTARASQFGDNFRLNRATISRTGETVTAM